jgi:tetratricopeptide (TPR) repeat protein
MKRQGMVVGITVAAVTSCLASAAPGQTPAPGLLDARTVLAETRHAPAEGAPRKSEGAQLADDIRDFRAHGSALEPSAAVSAWFALLDRAAAAASRFGGDVGAYDVDTQMPVGVSPVLAALPAPPAWPVLRAEASRRAKRAGSDYHALGVELLGDVLVGDRGATAASLSAIERAVAALPPGARVQPHQRVVQVRNALMRLYGTPAEVARSFLDDAAGGEFSLVEVPDLVTLIGEAEAAWILRDALTRPVALHVASGDATRALARRIALEQIDTLKLPQWGLIDSLDAAPLYEALSRRFVANAPAASGEESRLASAAYNKDEADVYYLLYLIVNGRNADAEKTLQSFAAGERLTIPEAALEALQRAHENEALFAFLGSVLTSHPDMRVWDVYIQQAAYTGHSREALALLDSLLKRTDLQPYARTDLQLRRADALLGLGDTAHGLPALAAVLRSAPPLAADPLLAERTKAAVRLAGLGRVLSQPELGNVGLRFAEDAVRLPAEKPGGSFDRIGQLHLLLAELRKEHRDGEAQRIAIAELKRPDDASDVLANQMELMGLPGNRPARRAALVELVSLYAAAGRAADVRVLLDESPDWGARDLSEQLAEKDSQGTPFAVSVARALAASGDPAAAARIATAAIRELPGNDAAYELESSVDPRALEVFDAQFATDQFEKRPLIWRAALLERKGQLVEAEKAVRAAIAIDPSDGDEGINDRMRAYAVLADILEARGDSQGAAEFRSVVTAIRISEKSDELYALGLYQAAFAGYREALDHFSDAYCIQSRLAVQLNRLGQHEQAARHYRRAYELMPASFGRVESHCFGCESVFDGAQAQSIADEVFQALAKRNPGNAQVHYLQGYLWEHEGKYAQALPAYRTAVQIDGDYLNAWRHMYQLSEHLQLDAVDRDVATVKLLQLDPQQRHVTYDLNGAGDFNALWNAVAEASRLRGTQATQESLYPFMQSAALADRKQSALPPELRAQTQLYQALIDGRLHHRMPSAPLTIGQHRLILGIGGLISGDTVEPGMD